MDKPINAFVAGKQAQGAPTPVNALGQNRPQLPAMGGNALQAANYDFRHPAPRVLPILQRFIEDTKRAAHPSEVNPAYVRHIIRELRGIAEDVQTSANERDIAYQGIAMLMLHDEVKPPKRRKKRGYQLPHSGRFETFKGVDRHLKHLSDKVGDVDYMNDLTPIQRHAHHALHDALHTQLKPNKMRD